MDIKAIIHESLVPASDGGSKSRRTIKYHMDKLVSRDHPSVTDYADPFDPDMEQSDVEGYSDGEDEDVYDLEDYDYEDDDEYDYDDEEDEDDDDLPYDFVDEGVADKIWNWWHKTSAKELAKEVRKASFTDLLKITNRADVRSAKTHLSGPELVEFMFAVKRLEKMKKDDPSLMESTLNLENGSIIQVSEEDMDALSMLYVSLNEDNQADLIESLMLDEETFENILSFAKKEFD